MEAFNILLNTLPFNFNLATETQGELAQLRPDQLRKLQEPINLPNLKLYYPISRYDELGYRSVQYESITPSSLQIIHTIKKTYQTPLIRKNLLFYAQKRPEEYTKDLLKINNPGNQVLLLNMIGERYYLNGLRPYNDGYLIELSH